MNIAIVIPVYNEAERLGACLEAISRQSVTPAEVIVVDNNSTDRTAEIARKYSFVRLIREPRQGVVYARNRGFDSAQSAIIGRIDADSIIADDWVETVQRIFMDKNISAVSGSITYHDIPLPQLFAKLELFFRQRIANKMGDEVFLYGANMAIRRTTWRNTRRHVCNKGGMHEDFDLAIHAEETGAKVVFDASLHAYVSLRRFDTTFVDFLQYVWLNPKTYALHGRRTQRHMYTVIALVLLGYGSIRVLYKGYDQSTGTFSLKRAFAPVADRVNPATFVD